MTYLIAKKSGNNFIYVRSIDRAGNVKDNEIQPKENKPAWFKQYKNERTANSDLEKMRSRGYDDYEVYNVNSFEWPYNSLGRTRFI